MWLKFLLFYLKLSFLVSSKMLLEFHESWQTTSQNYLYLLHIVIFTFFVVIWQSLNLILIGCDIQCILNSSVQHFTSVLYFLVKCRRWIHVIEPSATRRWEGTCRGYKNQFSYMVMELPEVRGMTDQPQPSLSRVAALVVVLYCWWCTISILWPKSTEL